MSIDTATTIAVYAAGLSTTTALVSFARMIRDRPSIAVQASFSFAAASSADDVPKGTPVEMHEPGLIYECLVHMRIVNRGRRAVQVVAVVVEGVAERNKSNVIASHEVRPHPLPTVLEPLSSVEVSIQKEHFDQDDELLFLGVLDALGHRHATADEDILKILETNQTLPTSIALFQRRDDPTKKIAAWQTKDVATMTTRPLPSTHWPLDRERRRVARARRQGWPRPVSPAASDKRAALAQSGAE